MRVNGFTLMEVMVTIVIFSIIMLALFSSFQSFISSRDSITKGVHECERVRAALERICEDMELIHMVQPPRYQVPDFDAPPDPYRMAGSEIPVGSRIFSRLEFSSMARVIVDHMDVKRISKITYYVKQNPDNSYDLCRSDQLPEITEEINPCRDPVLLKHIQAFEIEYMDAEGDIKKNWDSDSDDFNHTMPIRLHIKMKTDDKDKTGGFETAIFLPVKRGLVE